MSKKHLGAGGNLTVGSRLPCFIVGSIENCFAKSFRSFLIPSEGVLAVLEGILVAGLQ
jgi:hypothetical protein